MLLRVNIARHLLIAGNMNTHSSWGIVISIQVQDELVTKEASQVGSILCTGRNGDDKMDYKKWGE